MAFAVESIEQRLHRGADLLRSLVASVCHEAVTIAPRLPIAYGGGNASFAVVAKLCGNQ